MQNTSLGIEVDLDNTASSWIGSISMFQNVPNFPLETISFNDGKATFRIKDLSGNATFTGVVSADGNTLDGQYTQGRIDVPLKLNRTGEPKLVPLKVTILGSGGGPPVNLQRFGPSTLVETVTGDRFLIDCGRGFAQRLTEYGMSLGAIDKLFLTHLHSDHILSIPDLLLVGWQNDLRQKPLQVWGPAGTKDMMDALRKAFNFDIGVRAQFDDRLNKENIYVAGDIDEGVVYDKNGAKVTAFLVDHGGIKPAFGYRIDYGGHSVAMSGDTRFSENLIRHAQGVDVLIHESGPPDPGPLPPTNDPEIQRYRQFRQTVASFHTPARDAAIVFNRVKPRLAVYAHGGGPAIMAETRKSYTGPLEDSEDLMMIEIGNRVEVRRRPR
jgi:ribonuclease Z